jgi:hypothetical protein
MSSSHRSRKPIVFKFCLRTNLQSELDIDIEHYLADDIDRF